MWTIRFMWTTKWPVSVLLCGTVAIAVASLGACRSTGTQKGTKTTPGASATAKGAGRCDTTGKQIIKLDINEDKQPDVWKLYTKKIEDGDEIDVLTCKERDLNFDGRKDIWYHYDDEGNVNLEEMDLDFDGRVDLVTVQRGGRILRQEMDSNHDGSVDVWKHYEEEILVRIERDTNGDGRVDYWEYYEGGQLDRIGNDRNGDGQVDHWDRAPTQQSDPKPATKEES